MTTRKPGRPPKGATGRTEFLRLRIEPAAKLAAQLAARAAGVSVADWIARLIHRETQRR